MTDLIDRVELTPEQRAIVNKSGAPAQATQFLMTHFQYDFETALAKSEENYHRIRKEWVEASVMPFARKHNLTLEQALSVLVCDNPSEGKTAREVMSGPACEYYCVYTMRDMGLMPWLALGQQRNAA